MLKHIFFVVATLSLACSHAQSSKAFHSTVFDEDNNPIARGVFKSAVDSGIIIRIDQTDVFINASEIFLLKIEKDPSKTQFLQLGVASATEAVSYWISKPKKDQISDSSEQQSTDEPLSTATRQQLLTQIQSLLENLLNKQNDLATFSINNSQEKYRSKIRLLQQYTMDNEKNEHQIENSDQTIATTTADQSNSSSSIQGASFPGRTKTVQLQPGFHFVNPKPAQTTASKNDQKTSTNFSTSSSTLRTGDQASPTRKKSALITTQKKKVSANQL